MKKIIITAALVFLAICVAFIVHYGWATGAIVSLCFLIGLGIISGAIAIFWKPK